MLRLQPYRLTSNTLSSGLSCPPCKPFHVYCHQVQYAMQTAKELETPPLSKSPHVEFYKFFGRPFAKVLLISACTYQLAYLLWVNEQNKEFKAEKVDQIVRLEEEVRLIAATATTSSQ